MTGIRCGYAASTAYGAGSRSTRRKEFAAWLAIPASEDPELAYMGVEDVVRKYRVDEKLADIRLR